MRRFVLLAVVTALSMLVRPAWAHQSADEDGGAAQAANNEPDATAEPDATMEQDTPTEQAASDSSDASQGAVISDEGDFGETTPTAPEAEGDGSPAERADRATRGIVPRVLVAPLMGWVVGLVGLGVGALVGVATCTDDDEDGDPCNLAVEAIVGAALGYLIGTPVGVRLAAGWFDGLGTLEAAAWGAAVGIVLGGVAYFATSGDWRWGLAATALPPISSMIGYEISSARAASDLRVARATPVVPTLTLVPDPRGGTRVVAGLLLRM